MPPPSTKVKAPIKPTRSKEFTLELELRHDVHYPDFLALSLMTGKDRSHRITPSKATGSWKTMRKWTVTISENDLKTAKAFSKKMVKEREDFQENLHQQAEERKKQRNGR
jgi:hypothetical protein